VGLKRSTALFWLFVILAFGTLFRIVFAKECYFSNFDTGTVGWMAVNILEGERPAFFYGQNYMGALEAYVGAIMIGLFGVSDLAISLSTTLFAAFWIWSNYLLFTTIAKNRRSGLIAALIVAFPGFWIVKYSISPYGGYTIAFFAGTMVLWLAVRLYQQIWIGLPRLMHIIGIGFFAAIGLWTHYLVAPYLLVSAILCLAVLKRDFSFGLVASFGLGAVIALLGMIPALLLHDTYTGSQTVSFSFLNDNIRTSDHLEQAWRVLRKDNVPRLGSWDMESVMSGSVANLLRILAAILVGIGAIGYIGFTAYKERKKSSHEQDVVLDYTLIKIVPLLFVVLFLLLYLPHGMAIEIAPRYMISAWVILLSAIFGLGLGSWKGLTGWIGLGLAALFCLYQFGGQLLYIKEQKEIKISRHGIFKNHVNYAREGECQTVSVVGGQVDGHEGQIFSFHSKGNPVFTSIFDERHQPSAQAAETNPARGWTLLNPMFIARMRQAFWDLGVKTEENGTQHSKTFFKAEFDQQPADNIDRNSLTVALDGDINNRLTDRDWNTSAELHNILVIDLGSTQLVNRIWLFSPDNMQTRVPTSYVLKGSTDGQDIETIIDCRVKIGQSYISGPTVFFKGYFAKWEVRFPARRVRFLSLEHHKMNPKPGPWNLNELYVFNQPKRDISPIDFDLLGDSIRRNNLDFVIADRWHSAKLIQANPNDTDQNNGSPIAYPRYNPKHASTQIPRTFIPRKGLGLLIERGLVAETTELVETMYGSCLQKTENFGEHILLTFDDPSTDNSSALETSLGWNGHTLMKILHPESIR